MAVHVGAHTIICNHCNRIILVGLVGYPIPEDQLADRMDAHLTEFHADDPDIISL